MRREEYILTTIRYWGEHDGEHMFGVGDPPYETKAENYWRARYLLYDEYHPTDEPRIVGESFWPDGKRKPDQCILPQRFVTLLKLVAFPRIIE